VLAEHPKGISRAVRQRVDTAIHMITEIRHRLPNGRLGLSTGSGR
jgi:hypothetical protein